MKSERPVGDSAYFPGFQNPLHLGRSGTLVAGFYFQFFHSRHLLPLLNQPHHFCEWELRHLRLCLHKWFSCLVITDTRVWIWKWPLVLLLIVHLSDLRGGWGPLFVAAVVYWLHKPGNDTKRRRRRMMKMTFTTLVDYSQDELINSILQ